jgi:hypothetical protein
LAEPAATASSTAQIARPDLIDKLRPIPFKTLRELGGEQKLCHNIAGLTDWGYSTKVQ